MTGGEIALITGLTGAVGAALVSILKVIERIVARNGKKSTPPDLCVDCRKTVTDTSYSMKAFIEVQDKNQERMLVLLGDIRDGVRDLKVN